MGVEVRKVTAADLSRQRARAVAAAGLDPEFLLRLAEDGGEEAVVSWLEDHQFWALADEWKFWGWLAGEQTTPVEPIRWWPFHSAPAHLQRFDNGGDEDWLFHIPASWLAEPLAACEQHGRQWQWPCADCEDSRRTPPSLIHGWIDFDVFAVAGAEFYPQEDGSVVCITHHA